MATGSLGRSFHGLWAATGAANLGDGMALFALPLLAIAAGASPGEVAAVTVALTLAWPVVGLHAGWIVDRVHRHHLMIGVNLVRAGVLSAVTFGYLADRLSLPLILLAAALLGVAETLVDTALTAMIPTVVPAADRTRANARIEATINVANQLAGPPLAGLLAGLSLATATGASAVLYALAIAGILLITVPRPPAPASAPAAPPAAAVPPAPQAPPAPPAVPPTPAPPGTATPARGSASTGVVAGLGYLWRQPVLRSLTLFTAAMNVVWAAALSLLVVHAVHPGPLGLTPAAYGLMLTGMAGGGLVAATLVPWLQRRIGVARLLIADCAGTVLLVLPVAVGADALLVTGGVVAAGAGASVWRILVATIRQNLSPPDLLGRVYAASRVISWGVLPGGAALAGLGAEVWGVRTVFVLATGLALATLVPFVAFTRRHDLTATMAAPAVGGRPGGDESR